MNIRRIAILIVLVIGIAGCSVQSNLNRTYIGKTQEELMLSMGRPTKIETLTGGRKVSIYQKSKFLKPVPINTGQFQYDKFESPKAIKNETYSFFLDNKGVVEKVLYKISYER